MISSSAPVLPLQNQETNQIVEFTELVSDLSEHQLDLQQRFRNGNLRPILCLGENISIIPTSRKILSLRRFQNGSSPLTFHRTHSLIWSRISFAVRLSSRFSCPVKRP